MSAVEKLPCQVCGRSLAVRRDGLTKPHMHRDGWRPMSKGHE